MTNGDRYPPHFAYLARQIDRERAEARAVLVDVIQEINSRLNREIPAAWCTIGFVMELNNAAPDLRKTDFKAARRLAQFALAVLTRIPRDAYPPAVRRATEAIAWKELANAHRYLSDYDAAHRALDAGERCLADSLTSAYDRALLQLARAIVYCDQHKFDEADRELAKSVRVFEEHSDAKQLAKCRLLQGISEHRRGMLREACVSYAKATEAARQTNDLATLASAFNNLGYTHADLGEHAAAVEALHQALPIFEELGMASEAIRTRWVLGRVLLSQGRYQQARAFFVDARAGFLEFGMAEEAGLTGLDLVEALLGLSELGRARIVLETVAGEFQRANLGERAAAALDYLRDMVGTLRGREATRHVREYVKRLREEPLQAFVPLPPD